MSIESFILTINSGSSSIKFALFEVDLSNHAGTGDTSLEERARGQIDGLGGQPRFVVRDRTGTVLMDHAFEHQHDVDHAAGIATIVDFCTRHAPNADIVAVGHRVVHGGLAFTGPTILDADRIETLETLTPFAPLHQPHNLAGVRAAQNAFSSATQYACFDTAFHRSHPWVNDTFALPRRYYHQGVRRYGFHGLSYEYVSQTLSTIAPTEAGHGVIVAHLGNGASMCAIRNGESVASTMGFSALDGLPMGTRCGQLDPGVVLYLMAQERLSAREIEDLLYRESGLKGLSGLSHDMRTLQSAGLKEADEAIDYFVFRVRRELGAMMLSINSFEGLAFCGGIGENAATVRSRICADLGWIGVELDADRNEANATLISTDASRVKVWVIPTNEELMIARHGLALLTATPQREA